MRGLHHNLDKSEARKVLFHVPVADPLPLLCRMGGGFCSGILTGLAYGGVRWCISKLSKLLHQEDALGAPFSGCDFCSPQAPGGAGMLRTGVIRRFRVTSTVATPKSSRRHALMLFQWLAAVHELRALVQGQT